MQGDNHNSKEEHRWLLGNEAHKPRVDGTAIQYHRGLKQPLADRVADPAHPQELHSSRPPSADILSFVIIVRGLILAVRDAPEF